MENIDFQKIITYLRKNLSRDRFFHSLKVAQTAKKLAQIHKGVDPNKAYLAGLVHDFAREMKDEDLISFAREHRIKIDSFSKGAPFLLHAQVAAKKAKKEFNIYDREILQAIEKHCVPKPYMDLLDKIIYLSDIITPTPKTWAGLLKGFEMARDSLDKALLYAYNENIKHFIREGRKIHPDLLRARNKLIENLRRKILILGYQGMLGSELNREFKDWQVTGWDKKELDITNKKKLERKITKLNPEIIINAAAYTNVEEAETNQRLALKVNGKAVGYLAQIAKRLGAILIHYSTDYVFDGKNRKGYKETAQPNPINVYGKSKFLGEALLHRHSDKYYLIRSSWMFGKGGNDFVKKMLQLGKENAKLKVVNDQHGKPTYASDLAYGTKRLLEQAKPFGIYHLTNEGKTTWYQFARKIFALKKIKVEITPITSQEYKSQAKRPLYSVLINTKLSKLRHWEEALEEYLNLISN